MLSFPFRVGPSHGGVVANSDGSDQEITEAIVAHVLTTPGERPLRPGFGTESLPFSNGLDQGTLQLQLNEHGWEHVTITDIHTGTPEQGRVESSVEWERNT